MKKEHKEYLDELKENGITNMFGAVPYIMDEFGVDKKEAGVILKDWMNNFNKYE